MIHYEKTSKLIDKAKELFPNDNFFYNVEINIAVSLNNVDEARVKVEERLNADPSNPGLHFNRAVLYYNLGINLSENSSFSEDVKLDTLDKVYKSAIESYKNTLQLDPIKQKIGFIVYLL